MTDIDVTIPVIVTDTPTPITPLQSALNKLLEDDSKILHLEPAERRALRDRVSHLEFELGKLDVALYNARLTIAHMEKEWEG